MSQTRLAVAVRLLVTAQLALAKEAIRVGAVAIELGSSFVLPTQLAYLCTDSDVDH